MDVIEQSVSGEMDDPVLAEFRTERRRPTRLKIERLPALPLRDERQDGCRLAPRVEQSPELCITINHPGFSSGPRHLQRTEIDLARSGRPGFACHSAKSRIIFCED